MTHQRPGYEWKQDPNTVQTLLQQHFSERSHVHVYVLLGANGKKEEFGPKMKESSWFGPNVDA